jgi:ABC-type branched-subunit amino acid transport system ATPase component/ABC-type branched-subunit amino acid transport system permease subunit
MNYIQFLLLGLASGSVFAALALALVMTYRSSGVINFAVGSFALVATDVYGYLRQGQLLVLVPGLPATVGLGSPLGFWPALLIAVCATALLGLVIYLLVFRPLRAAPPVTRAVAALAINALVVALIAARIGTNALFVGPIFPGGTFHIGSASVPADRLWVTGTIVLLALAIGAAYRYTRFGVMTRAVAESEEGAVVSGIKPDRVAAVNWMISAAVAGLAGILVAPVVTVVPDSYTLFVIPALAAAIIGGFQSMPVAVAAGLAIGMLQSVALLLQSTYSWLPQSGLAELIPLVLLLVVLLLRSHPLPDRGTLIRQTLGRAPRPRMLAPTAIVAVAAAAVALAALQGSWRAALLTSLITGIVALSWVVVTGYAGQISLAQLGLAGAAAYLLTFFQDSWGVPFPFSVLLAGLGASVVAVVIGLPALRLRGLAVAVVTLAAAYALENLWFDNNSFNGGFKGAIASGPNLAGLNLGIGSGTAFPRLSFCFLVLIVLLVTGVCVARLRTSRLGTAMLAVRANERATAAAGINVVRVKLTAFAIGGFIAGVGGAFMAYDQGTLSSDSFTTVAGLALFTTVYLAGITSIAGGLASGFLAAGGLLYTLFQQWLSLSLNTWYEVILALLLLITLIFNPEGASHSWHLMADRINRRWEATRKKPTPAAAADAPAPAPNVEPKQASQPPAAAPRGAPAADLLSARQVRVAYGGVVAVADVSVTLAAGSIAGVIGPNGAGKTTFIDALSGFAAYSGHVDLAGARLDGLPPHKRVRAGIGRTLQNVELYDGLSVEENVQAGLRRSRSHGPDPLGETFALLGLATLRHAMAGDLSQGQRQLVSIARALAGRPRVLLLDEPAAGLDTRETAWLAGRLRDVRDTGIAILLVDHDMSLVLNLCDHIYVLDFGQLIASGPPAAIQSDPRVAAAYLGTGYDTDTDTAARAASADADTGAVLAVSDDGRPRGTRP